MIVIYYVSIDYNFFALTDVLKIGQRTVLMTLGYPVLMVLGYPVLMILG